ncbi:MFS transporter [Thalassobaculum sp.]|uniref:MFS transporter n=1 Tax=Thalassobaculum sp. TaxID=2022740 RepID=UPI0032F00962
MILARAAALDWRLLLFGFLMAFGSSFGQTFFISLFSAEFRAAFGLSHGGFGALYSAATLTSGLLLLWVGGMIDRVDLRLFGGLVLLGIAGASALAAATAGPVMLVAALFCLRFFGQGLASHTAVTAVARYADPKVRGRSVSLAALGFPAGEAVWPAVAVALIAVIGWRWTYVGAALLAVGVYLPLAMVLLASHGRRHTDLLARTEEGGGDAMRQWTRREVIGDPTFLWSMAAVLAPSFIVTGILFHQVHLTETKGWNLGVFAAGYVAYAACQIAVALVTGPAIDRVGARRVARFYLTPLVGGLVLLSQSDAVWAGLFFLAMCGATSGASSTLLGTLWAEIYGVRHLGAIRALVTACTVVSSALSPAMMGWALDAGVSIESIAVACAVYVVGGIGVLAVLFRPSRI